jgi:precorrin-3B C17-methyltransferase
MMRGVVKVVGLGPGSLDLMAPAALQAIESSDVILGYSTYLNLIADIAPDIPRVGSGMRKEVDRAREAINLAAEGKTVAVVSSGDPGVYGMAGLIFEMREQIQQAVEIEVYPGITAVNAAASLLGAPLMTDFVTLSLSDQLTPLDEITQRLDMAAKTDFVICLYNPKGKKRHRPFDLACEILLNWRSQETPVGIVRKAYRSGQEVEIIRLKDLPTTNIDMFTVLIVGNRDTQILDGKMVTPRGYQNKYVY